MQSHNHCLHGKAVSIKYCECVSAALVMQHAKCMCHITLSPVPVWIYHVLLHYFINNTIFEKKLLNIKCVFLFSLQLCLKYFSFCTEFSKISQIYVKYPLLSDFTELFHVERQANRHDEVNSHFLQFCKSDYKPKALNLNTVPTCLEPLVRV